MEDFCSGRQAVTKVVLHPRIEWEGAAPDQAKLDAMHHEAHEVCYIANSVRTEITIA
jgi:organic hydroperoxide reductase OsmC/OhrA